MMQTAHLASSVWRHPLNAGQRMRAMARVVRWQIASRLIAGPLVLPFVDATNQLVARGMTGATGNWYCGLHEVETMGFVLHLLRPDELFLDVGANVGSYSVLAAGGIHARVIAIEPIPATFAHLQRNIGLNQLADRIEAHCIGLSDKRDELRFTDDQDTVNHVMTDDERGSGVDVAVISMDELLGDRVPVVIKIDVEGHERAVLGGATRTLSQPGLMAVVMEMNGSGGRYGVADDELLQTMRRYGFSPFGYNAISRRLSDWHPANDNAIFLRDRRAVDPRLMEAKRHDLVNGTI